MDDLYKKLGFVASKILTNPYGIKIYVGTKGGDDWCVLVPKEIVSRKLSSDIAREFREQDYIAYLITEQQALSTAERWTKFAKGIYEL